MDNKMNFYNPKTILIAGLLCFAVALVDLLTRCPDQIYNWHLCLSAIGWAGLIGVCASIGWLVISTLLKLRR